MTRAAEVGIGGFFVGNKDAPRRILTDMTLLYRVLADLIVIVHFAYVLGVIVGLLLVVMGILFRWQWVRGFWFRAIHLAMILIVVLEAWFGVVCPLTTWEHSLRDLAGQETYRGDFLANFVHDLLFVEAPPWAFTLAYSGFGLLVLLTFVLAPPRRPGTKPA